ncbi:Uncharacterised protein [Candidatus Burarchaeum australiense]|nr:Uncharacterised protein [Candidatus Burarchaeum australiense]
MPYSRWRPRPATWARFSKAIRQLRLGGAAGLQTDRGDSLYIIVGVDPGTTIAIAAVDLNGKIVGAWSGRDEGKERTLEHARRFGVPCLFASDVAKAPETVAKIAAWSNVRLFTPPRDMTQSEKIGLAKGQTYSNEHELDAIAAALRAYHNFENKLRMIDRAMAELGLEARAEEVKRLAIGGLSVHLALLMFEEERKLREPRSEGGGKEQVARQTPEQRRDLAEELMALANSNMELRKAVERLEREKAELEERLREVERSVAWRLRRDAEIAHRDRMILSLRERLDERWGRKGGKKGQGGKAGEKSEGKSGEKAGARKDLKGLAEKGKEVDLDALVQKHRYG